MRLLKQEYIDMEVLKKYEEVQSYISKVQEHADKNREFFGFLAASAYEELALKDQLWVIATDSKKDVAGYLMFGGVYPHIKIFQLFSHPESRQRGVAKRLVDELIKFGEKHNYLHISARVAADLEANSFWEKMHFKVTKLEKGGATTNRTINARSYRLKGKDLLSDTDTEDMVSIGYLEKPILSIPTYALDLNPLFDITKNREGMSESRIIFNDGFSGLFNICVTPEFKNELARNSDNFKKDPILLIARSLPTLPKSSEDKINNICEELRRIIFPDRSPIGKKAINDNSDLAHIAHCIINRLTGFITREKALLKSSNILQERYGIKILSPDEISGYRNEIPYIQISTQHNCTVTVKQLENSDLDKVSKFLNSLGIPTVPANKLLAKNAGHKRSEKLAICLNNQVIGYTSWNKPTKMNNIVDLHLYIDENASGSTSAIDHILECVTKDAIQLATTRVDLYINERQALTRDTAIKRGFIQSTKTNNLSKVSYSGYINEANWHKFKREFEHLTGLILPNEMPNLKELANTGIPVKRSDNLFYKCLNLFEFETLISPGFLFPRGRECLLLPIQEKYATRLFGNLRGQIDLIPSDGVSLLLERAYFRSTARSSYFHKGDIAMFYISGQKSIQEIVGIARVTHSEVIDSQNAIIKLKRQGVLSGEELEEIANHEGVLHAFTFDNYNELPSRLSFKKLKAMNIVSGANLTTVEKICYRNLKKIIDAVY